MKHSIIKEFGKNKFNLKELPEGAKIHFIGLGGIGMSALARILLQSGYKISGSDLKKNHLLEYFENQGSEVYIGHSEENLNNCCTVIKSSAIKEDNPEYKNALKNNIPVIHRSELLNALMTELNEFSIGVTGTHGKTSTTGMITTIFYKAGLEPSFAIGGEIPQLNTNSAFGRGKYFIAELDESDGTIELYSPNISVITNLELEHTDHYKDGLEQLVTTMERFADKTPENSKIVINIDDFGNNKLLKRTHRNNFVTYSVNSQDADYFAEIIEAVPNGKMKIYKKNEYLGEIKLGVPGIHNISNALGAAAVSLECRLDFKNIASALSKFTGMKKRFQTLGFANGARIIDDYAHHPTEIMATIDTARKIVNLNNKNNSGRIIAVFQPHRYTRLANLWNDFLKCFGEADIIYVCDVYAASEDPIENVNSENFTKQLGNEYSYYVKGKLDNVADEIIKEIHSGDIVLTMGAGTITKLGGMIIDKVSGK